MVGKVVAGIPTQIFAIPQTCQAARGKQNSVELCGEVVKTPQEVLYAAHADIMMAQAALSAASRTKWCPKLILNMVAALLNAEVSPKSGVIPGALSTSLCSVVRFLRACVRFEMITPRVWSQAGRRGGPGRAPVSEAQHLDGTVAMIGSDFVGRGGACHARGTLGNS